MKCPSTGQKCYGFRCNTVYRCSDGQVYEETGVERPNFVYYCKDEDMFYKTKPKKCLTKKEREKEEQKKTQETLESIQKTSESHEIRLLAREIERVLAQRENQRIQLEEEEKKEERIKSLENVIETRMRNISKGRVDDSRDHASYKTVKIGTQIWMAEDLRYKKRTYNIMDLDAMVLCPNGWHLPTSQEWYDLLFYMFGVENDGQYMEMLNRQQQNGMPLINGDEFGFSANSHSYWMYNPDDDSFYLVDFDCGVPQGCENNTAIELEAFCSGGCRQIEEYTKLPSYPIGAANFGTRGGVRCVKD